MEPPKKDEEEDTFTFTGKTLDAEGNIESEVTTQKTHHRVRIATWVEPPARALGGQVSAQELELEARAPRAEADYVPPPEPAGPRLPNAVFPRWPILLVIALLVGGGWYYFFGHKKEPTGPPIAVTITITSEPNGAAVSVEGTSVGVTPWAVDNTWGSGAVHVTLTHPGYRPWSGTFSGGRPARLEARLQKR